MNVENGFFASMRRDSTILYLNAGGTAGQQHLLFVPPTAAHNKQTQLERPLLQPHDQVIHFFSVLGLAKGFKTARTSTQIPCIQPYLQMESRHQ